LSILLLFSVLLTVVFSVKVDPKVVSDMIESEIGAFGEMSAERRNNLISALYGAASLDDFEVTPDLECIEPIVPYTCTPFTSSRDPDNVNQLTVADIDVVMAMGDSITAGFGEVASCILTVFRESVGTSWSIGGDYSTDQLITIPNILKHYNPNLKGYSTGWRIYSFSSAGSRLNAAISGARSVNLLEQAKWLVEQLNDKKSGVDVQKDWKMLTIFIGGNDLCAFCDDPNDNSAANYEQKLTEALKYLQANVPRVFVNIAAAVDVTELYQLNGEGILCSLLHGFECPCGTSDDKSVRDSVSAEHQKYLDAGSRVSQLFNDDPQFTVVMQPFFTNTHVPLDSKGNIDMSYFAPDCFHFSVKAHQAAAVGLWNNMLEKVGSKDPSYDWPVEPITCPTPDQYIPTNTNSKK